MLAYVRYAARTLLKKPGFLAACLLALVLGIGVNTAIFTVVNAVLIKQLPYKDADKIVYLARMFPSGPKRVISVPRFFAWKEGAADVLTDVSTFDFFGPGVTLSSNGASTPEQIKAIHVSHDFFSIFGIAPFRGRFFLPEEDRPGGTKVAIISHGLWSRRFGADPGVMSSTIWLSGEPYSVIGITPPDFEPNPPADLWMPLQLDPRNINQTSYLYCAGRLKPGSTLAAATARLQVLTEDYRRKFPAAMDKQETASVIPMRDLMTGSIRPILLIILGAVLLVQLIACTNVANLLLVRNISQEKEMAVRTSLGASRRHIALLLVTESVLLAMAGGVLGLLLGYIGVRVLMTAAPTNLPRFVEMNSQSSLDIRVLGFALLLSLVSGLLCALPPLLRTSRVDLNSLLKEETGRGTSGVRRSRVRSILLVSEMALSLVLLVGAGLLIRSAIGLSRAAVGFETLNVLTFKTALSSPRYARTAAVTRFSRDLLNRLEALPGVRAAANITTLPTEGGPEFSFSIAGSSAADTNGNIASWRFASPHTFTALGIPLVRGRVFTDNDTADSSPVVIISESMARKFFSNTDPLGRQITIGNFKEPPREIVGIVGDLHDFGLMQQAPPTMYIPQPQVSDGVTGVTNRVIPTSWVMSTDVSPATLDSQVRQELVKLDPQQAVFDVQPISALVEKSTASFRFVLLLLTIFAAVGVALAAIGIFGFISYMVEQRKQELAMRMALGARRLEILSLVLKYCMTLAAVGAVLGIAASLGLARLLTATLYGVKPTDFTTFIGATTVLIGIAVMAAWMPARRVARLDPSMSLRHQ